MALAISRIKYYSAVDKERGILQSTFDYVVVKNAVFCKSGDKAPKKNKKLTESGGKTSKFGQNLVGVAL